MPKQKSHSGAKKRFRVTRNGKVMARQRNRNHILEKKNSRRKRRLAGEVEITGASAQTVRRLLKQ